MLLQSVLMLGFATIALAGEYIPAPDVTARTPGFDPAALPGQWGEGNGAVRYAREDWWSKPGYTVMSNRQGFGDSHILTFTRDGRYKLVYTQAVTSLACANKSAAWETGAYRFDGRILTLQPAHFDQYVTFCGKNQHEAGNRLAPRQYQVYSAALKELQVYQIHPAKRSTGIILEGPCGKHLDDCPGTAVTRIKLVLQRLDR